MSATGAGSTEIMARAKKVEAAAPTQVERRAKLNDMQFTSLSSASGRVATTRAKLQEYEEYMRTVFALIADATGVPSNAQVSMDERTHELVWLEAAQAAPAPTPAAPAA